MKQNLERLTWIAALLFVMRFFDTVFQVEPQYHDAFTIHWTDVATFVGHRRRLVRRVRCTS